MLTNQNIASDLLLENTIESTILIEQPVEFVELNQFQTPGEEVVIVLEPSVIHSDEEVIPFVFTELDQIDLIIESTIV